MSRSPIQFQIGKDGLTQSVIDSLTLALKHHVQVRISLLKSTGRDREKTKALASEMLARLPLPCTSNIIGFTIILRKQKRK